MKLIFTLQFVYVLLVYKAILLLHVLKQVVPATMSVPLMKSVILPLVVALPVKNVNPFAILAIVLEVLIVLQRTIERPVLADSH